MMAYGLQITRCNSHQCGREAPWRVHVAGWVYNLGFGLGEETYAAAAAPTWGCPAWCILRVTEDHLRRGVLSTCADQRGCFSDRKKGSSGRSHAITRCSCPDNELLPIQRKPQNTCAHNTPLTHCGLVSRYEHRTGRAKWMEAF